MTFLLNAGFGDMVRARGIAVATVPARAGDPSAQAVIRNAERPSGLIGILRTISDSAALTDQYCDGGPAMLRALGVDALVGDQLEPATGLLGAALGVPWVSIASALPINRAPGVPMPYLGWKFDPSPRGLGNRATAERIGAWLSAKQNRSIRRWAAAFGAGPWSDLHDCLSPLAQISQLIPGYDFPRPEPVPFAAVGPIRPPLEDEPPLPFEPDPARPLVFASLGTLQGGRLDLFQVMARACRSCEAQLVVAHGGKLTAAQAASIDADHVTDFLPQRRVLRAASLCFSHGGLNTVLDCIAAKVPMIVRPFAFDQKGNCARILHHGIGEAMARPGALEAQVRRLLGAPGPRARLAALSKDMESAGGAQRAANIIERAIA